MPKGMGYSTGGSGNQPARSYGTKTSKAQAGPRVATGGTIKQPKVSDGSVGQRYWSGKHKPVY